MNVKVIKAGVAELKVTDDDVNSKAEYKCFFNMCGEAAKLAASVLCKGSLVKKVTIYTNHLFNNFIIL